MISNLRICNRTSRFSLTYLFGPEFAIRGCLTPDKKTTYINSIAQHFSMGMSKSNIPLHFLLRLNRLVKKTILSRKFYQEINDKVLKDASTVDTNLYFICYFTLLLSSILNNKPYIKRFLRKQQFNLLQITNKLAKYTLSTDLKTSPNKSVLAIFNQTEEAEVLTEEKSQLGTQLKTISSYLSDIRIFNRLTDSIKYAPWIIDEFSEFSSPKSTKPKLDRFVNLFQSLNCLVLELLENAGWLTDHNWVNTKDNNWWCIETYIWCSRVWAGYVVIEIVELIRRTPVKNWDNNWRINLFKNVIQLPLVVHWSMYEGCLSPFWVGVCGSGASWWGFRDMWGSIDLS